MAIRKPQKAVEKTGARYDELLAALNRQDSVPTPGTIVKGKVTGKRGNEILVDIGCKSAGAIPANEFENADEVKAGDEFDVLSAGRPSSRSTKKATPSPAPSVARSAAA